MIEELEARLAEWIAASPAPLAKAARYALFSPGKRLRPLLLWAAAKTCGADPSTLLDPACAVEMVHTYSLIHDDLPCMDDDAMRRGHPTLHKVVSEGMALLTGDYLLTSAFEMLSEAPRLSAEERLSLIAILARAAGAQGMVGGQALDLEAAGASIDEEYLLQMCHRKTARLFSACLEMGAVLGHASLEKRILLKKLGEELGLAYQFLDDLLDASPLSSDVKRNKSTSASLFSIREIEERIEKLWHSAEKKLGDFPELRPLAHKMLQRKIPFS